MITQTMSLLNENDDMVPPWEAFPTYGRYTIGWRMGSGEDYFYDWHTFIEKLSNDYETRSIGLIGLTKMLFSAIHELIISLKDWG